MNKKGLIIIIEDSLEDRRLFTKVFSELEISNEVAYFNTLNDAEEEMMLQKIKPFLIFANIVQFTEIRKEDDFINHTALFKRFKCPFVFFSILYPNCFFIDTYPVPAKSYFVNPFSEEKLKMVLTSVIQFWKEKDTENTRKKEKTEPNL